MSPLLWLGMGAAALLLAKKPATASTTGTATLATSGPATLPPQTTGATACNAPPAGSTLAGTAYMIFKGGGAAPERFRIGNAMLTPNGYYYVGPEARAIPEALGIQGPTCFAQWEGPYSASDLTARNYVIQ